jgi:hypothetical protein
MIVYGKQKRRNQNDNKNANKVHVFSAITD